MPCEINVFAFLFPAVLKWYNEAKKKAEANMAHQIVWCDIPVADLERAIKFYSAGPGKPVKKENFSGMSIGLLPSGKGEIGG